MWVVGFPAVHGHTHPGGKPLVSYGLTFVGGLQEPMDRSRTVTSSERERRERLLT